MACVKPDGTLTSAGEATLIAARRPIGEAELAAALKRPLFQARAIMREMIKYGFAEEADGLFRITASGEEKLRAMGK